MLYMVVERFKPGAAQTIYRRFREKGRMVPTGLNYISSWITADFTLCYQVMETEEFALFQEWTKNWHDLMDFEIVPVRTSAETASMLRAEARLHPCSINRVKRRAGAVLDPPPDNLHAVD